MGDKHLSTQFDSELNTLSSRVMEMGGLVESQIRDAIHALGQFNGDVARGVMEAESRVNAMELEIDRELSSVIARRQPTARDLRLLMAISKTTANLERVGELASSDGYEGGGMGAGMYSETGFDFDGLTHGGKHSTRDVFYEGKADDGVAELVKLVGEEWEKELRQLKEDGYKKLDADKNRASLADTEPAESKASSVSTSAASDANKVDKKEAGDGLANPTVKDDSSKLDELTLDLENKAKIDDKATVTEEATSRKEAKKGSS